MGGSSENPQLQAEQRARVLIDRQLRDAGWVVQGRADLNLFAGSGVAVREAIMAKGHGPVDYLLYVNQRVVGVIEAKPEGTRCRAWSGNRSCTPRACRPPYDSRR